MKRIQNILSRSLVKALYTSLVVFFLCITVFFGNLGPIPALIYTPGAFMVTFVVCLFPEALLEWKPGYSRKKTYAIVLLVISLVPAYFVLAEILEENTQAVRMKHALPLTEEERLLLQSTRLNFRVGVVNKKFQSVATSKLINDLQKTCLFKEVGELDLLDNADVIVTLEGYRRNPYSGLDFKIQLPEDPGSAVYKDVSYKLDRFFGGNADENQYIDRLAVELIKASQILLGQSELIATGPVVVSPHEQVGCQRD